MTKFCKDILSRFSKMILPLLGLISNHKHNINQYMHLEIIFLSILCISNLEKRRPRQKTMMWSENSPDIIFYRVIVEIVNIAPSSILHYEIIKLSSRFISRSIMFSQLLSSILVGLYIRSNTSFLIPTLSLIVPLRCVTGLWYWSVTCRLPPFSFFSLTSSSKALEDFCLFFKFRSSVVQP